jgi:predicted SprT family Zn-dependent metalloprotease
MTHIKICSVDGCGKPLIKGGYCNKHYLRFKRHGDPLAGRRSPSSNSCGKPDCPAAKKIFAHIHYLNNSEKYKTKAREWREKNVDAYGARKVSYFSREDVKKRMRENTKKWRKDNPDRKRKNDADFKSRNRGLVTSYKARYRASKRQATPAWLTKEQIEQIKNVYKLAKQLTEETGIPYEVDHIVPLAGGIVSGLHVPWNLRAIPKEINNRRPRIYNG